MHFENSVKYMKYTHKLKKKENPPFSLVNFYLTSIVVMFILKYNQM